jgi:hypothetical protein
MAAAAPLIDESGRSLAKVVASLSPSIHAVFTMAIVPPLTWLGSKILPSDGSSLEEIIQLENKLFQLLPGAQRENSTSFEHLLLRQLNNLERLFNASVDFQVRAVQRTPQSILGGTVDVFGLTSRHFFIAAFVAFAVYAQRSKPEHHPLASACGGIVLALVICHFVGL